MKKTSLILLCLCYLLLVPTLSSGLDLCTENGECTVGLYCEKDPGDCYGIGSCQPVPPSCAFFFDPVCGCDGVTYTNSCEAAMAEVNVACLGDCGSTVAPSTVSAGKGTYVDKITISWNNVAGELGYRVYRAVSPGGTVMQIGATAPDVTTYDDPQPCGGRVFEYRIKAIYSGGESGMSPSDTGYTADCVPVPDWTKVYNFEATFYDNALEQTADGGYVIAGSVVTGLGNYDGWIVKIDSTGAIVWQKLYDSGTDDQATSVIQTSDGGFLLAMQSGEMGEDVDDILVFKLDSSGNIIWQKSYGGAHSDYPRSILQTADGGYVVAGGSHSFSADFNADVWILKLDESGNVLWQKTYGGAASDGVSSIRQTGDGGYIVAGDTLSFGCACDFWIFKIDAAGAIDWQVTYGGDDVELLYSIRQTTDGGYLAAGYRSNSDMFDEPDAWIMKLDALGNAVWQKTYGGLDSDYAKSVQQTEDGGYIVGGTSSSSGAGPTVWAFKLDAGGSTTWSKIYGGLGDDGIDSLRQTADGGYIAAGYTGSFGAVLFDNWILKLDAAGLTGDCETNITADFSLTETSTTVEKNEVAMTTESTGIVPGTVGGSWIDWDKAVKNTMCPLVEKDWNGDGKPDIFWRNYVTGDNYVWYMDGVDKIGGDFVPKVAGTSWEVAGTADFNGDGHPDILWRDYAEGNGHNYIWYMDGVTKTGGHYVDRVSDINWVIDGVGDFNGDGKPDILWRNYTESTGDNYIWYMNNWLKTGGHYVNRVSDINWRIDGVADFDGDGDPDILWRNYAPGAGDNYIWYMDGWEKTGGHYVSRVSDTNWEAAVLDDFNNDGSPDILWRNYSTGDDYIWYLNDWEKTGGAPMSKIPDCWWCIEK